jgi:hypothetical protein
MLGRLERGEEGYRGGKRAIEGLTLSSTRNRKNQAKKAPPKRGLQELARNPTS